MIQIWCCLMILVQILDSDYPDYFGLSWQASWLLYIQRTLLALPKTSLLNSSTAAFLLWDRYNMIQHDTTAYTLKMNALGSWKRGVRSCIVSHICHIYRRTGKLNLVGALQSQFCRTAVRMKRRKEPHGKLNLLNHWFVTASCHGH